MTERQILPRPSTADLQAAMRALWPERDILYFRPGQDNGPVLTTEESAQLGAVAMAIARTRDEVLAQVLALADNWSTRGEGTGGWSIAFRDELRAAVGAPATAEGDT